MKPIRIKKRKIFLHINANGFRVASGGLVVQACQNDLGIVRTGFTVTKKIGCAVIRNRTRRRLKELVRTTPDIDAMIGFDFVFIGRLSTAERPYPKLQADLAFALSEIKKNYHLEHT